MTTPAPRPALRKAPDAHIHPAAPANGGVRLRAAAEGVADAAAGGEGRPAAPLTPVPGPRDSAEGGSDAGGGAEDARGRRLSGPLKGVTSDSLRTAGRRGGRSRRDERPREKRVELTVQVPKSLRKEFQAAAKARRTDPDAVVEALLRAWLDI